MRRGSEHSTGKTSSESPPKGGSESPPKGRAASMEPRASSEVDGGATNGGGGAVTVVNGIGGCMLLLMISFVTTGCPSECSPRGDLNYKGCLTSTKALKN